MRITILTNYDAASILALNYLAPVLNSHQLRVFYTDKSNNYHTDTPSELLELNAFERKEIEQDNTFDQLGANELNNINHNTDFEKYQLSKPDLVISIRHMSILKEPVISVPRHGVLNLHSGLLPHYRGVMATFWAMSNKETDIGTTLHYIEDSSIDTGRVISQSRKAIRYEKSYLWNTLNIYRKGCENISQAVTAITSDKILACEAQTGEGKYYSYPTAEQLNVFSRQLFNRKDSLSDFLNTSN